MKWRRRWHQRRARKTPRRLLQSYKDKLQAELFELLRSPIRITAAEAEDRLVRWVAERLRRPPITVTVQVNR